MVNSVDAAEPKAPTAAAAAPWLSARKMAEATIQNHAARPDGWRTLRCRFDLELYSSLKQQAALEAARGCRDGLQNLVTFFHNYCTENTFDPRIFQDFQDLAFNDYHRGHTTPMRKLWKLVQAKSAGGKSSRYQEMLKPQLKHLFRHVRKEEDLKGPRSSFRRTRHQSSEKSSPRQTIR